MENITAIIKEYKEERGLLVSAWSCVCAASIYHGVYVSITHYIFSTTYGYLILQFMTLTQEEGSCPLSVDTLCMIIILGAVTL